MVDMARLLDKQYEQMDFEELVNASVNAIAGISAGDAELLKKAFNVKTIGDLGTNKYILTAVAIATLADSLQSPHRSEVVTRQDAGIGRQAQSAQHHVAISDTHGIADARLQESGVPVWALAGYGPLVDWDRERIANDYELSLEEVDVALAYYDRHRDIIEARIAANTVPAI